MSGKSDTCCAPHPGAITVGNSERRLHALLAGYIDDLDVALQVRADVRRSESMVRRIEGMLSHANAISSGERDALRGVCTVLERMVFDLRQLKYCASEISDAKDGLRMRLVNIARPALLAIIAHRTITDGVAFLGFHADESAPRSIPSSLEMLTEMAAGPELHAAFDKALEDAWTHMESRVGARAEKRLVDRRWHDYPWDKSLRHFVEQLSRVVSPEPLLTPELDELRATYNLFSAATPTGYDALVSRLTVSAVAAKIERANAPPAIPPQPNWSRHPWRLL